MTKTPVSSEKKHCYICRTLTFIIDSHHVWPQAAGGTNGPVVDLCTKCHSGIHRAALNLIAKKSARRQYFSQEEMTRAAPLIRWLVVTIQQTSERRGPESKSIVTIEVTAELLVALHALKVDAGHTNLSVFCANILAKYASSKL